MLPDCYLKDNLSNTLNRKNQSIGGVLLEQDNHQRNTLLSTLLPFRKWIAEVIKVKERILALRIKGINGAYIALGVARIISEMKISTIIHD